MAVYIIDGVRCDGDQAVRDYCFNYTSGRGGFKQDFRLASQAYKLPVIKLIELLQATGHNVEKERA